MLYFFLGTDIDTSRTKAHELIKSLQKKKPDASVSILTTENFNENTLREYLGSQGLFVNKNIVFLDRLCEKKDTKEGFLDVLKEISESENIFITLEGKLDKASVTKIEKKAEKSVISDLKEKPVKKEYNAFALADAFARRDRKQAWMLYREAIDRGEAPEALHGMVFWKVKSMILSGGSQYWENKELMKNLSTLISLYHDARRGMYELETALEFFLLEI